MTVERQLRYLDLSPHDEPRPSAQSPTPADGSVVMTIRQLAQWIRDLYVSEYRRRHVERQDYGRRAIAQYDGGTDRFGVQRQEVWGRIAANIASSQCDPVKFMQAQFAASPMTVPRPQTMFGEESVKCYRQFCENVVPELRRALDSQLMALKSRLAELSLVATYTDRDRLLVALYDEVTVSATPLFRFCFATDSELFDVATYYHRQALSQYVFQQDDYNEAWGQVIPFGLRQEAARLRELLRY